MAGKRKLPVWLGLLLSMLLVTLVLMLIMVPEPEQSVEPARMSLPAKHAALRTPSPQRTAPNIIAPAVKIPPASAPSPEQFTEPAAHRGLALILDDVGYNLAALKRVLALSVPVAISVLPDAPHAKESARLAHQAGQVVMLHLPMQPEDPSLQMDDAFLIGGMSAGDLHDTFWRDLAKVPYVEGVNNHMGSKLTQQEEPMRQVMQQCLQQGLFFVDSRTSRYSVAAKVAADSGLQWATRQIFLDHIMTLEAMDKAWQQARSCVRKGRRCIIIAHPRAASVAFLESRLTTEDAAMMVSIKQLLRGGSHQVETAGRLRLSESR